MIELIDAYLASLGERSLLPTAEVKNLLLDLRLTFMVLEGEEVPDPPAAWNPLA